MNATASLVREPNAKVEAACRCREFGKAWDKGSRYLQICGGYEPYPVHWVTQCRECTHEKECHR